MDIRELIHHLNKAADALPDGLDSEVRVRVCNGHDAAGMLTKMIGVAYGEPGDGDLAGLAFVEAHPHSDDEDTVRRPVTMGVDDELARLVAGDAPPRPSITVVMGDTGVGVRLPYDQDGRVLLPGSPSSVAEGCTCDPDKNNHGEGVRIPDRDDVAYVYRDDCPVHEKVQVDPEA